MTKKHLMGLTERQELYKEKILVYSYITFWRDVLKCEYEYNSSRYYLNRKKGELLDNTLKYFFKNKKQHLISFINTLMVANERLYYLKNPAYKGKYHSLWDAPIQAVWERVEHLLKEVYDYVEDLEFEIEDFEIDEIEEP